MEENLTGRQYYGKTILQEDNLTGRKHLRKTTLQEYNLREEDRCGNIPPGVIPQGGDVGASENDITGRPSHWMTTLQEDNHVKR